MFLLIVHDAGGAVIISPVLRILDVGHIHDLPAGLEDVLVPDLVLRLHAPLPPVRRRRVVAPPILQDQVDVVGQVPVVEGLLVLGVQLVEVGHQGLLVHRRLLRLVAVHQLPEVPIVVVQIGDQEGVVFRLAHPIPDLAQYVRAVAPDLRHQSFLKYFEAEKCGGRDDERPRQEQNQRNSRPYAVKIDPGFLLHSPSPPIICASLFYHRIQTGTNLKHVNIFRFSGEGDPPSR